MTTGVLLYCFDTPEVQYHKLAERCIEQIKKYLQCEITVVTDIATFKRFKPMGMINYKLIEPSPGNKRVYRGEGIAWYNKERGLAYEHSPYDTTILMDCDYFVFSDYLIELSKTDFDVMIHDKVSDITGEDMIEGRDECVLPLVWATVTLFKKGKNSRAMFDMIKHIQKNYSHYQKLYRIRYFNYRNDFAFAIALHQLEIGTFIPTPMSMLADKVDVIGSDNEGLLFRYGDKVNFTSGQDVHVMDKEWCNE